jgi:hypothetical protein
MVRILLQDRVGDTVGILFDPKEPRLIASAGKIW